jgi:hypothetical protein
MKLFAYKPFACQFCTSKDIPSHLIGLRMCEWCCDNVVDIVDRTFGWPWRWALRRVVRRIHEVSEDFFYFYGPQ